jgi:chemotaxis signal transduction protein
MTSFDRRARVSELKQRFEIAFSEPPPRPRAQDDAEDLLALSLDSERYMLRLREVEGLYLDRTITPVPGAAAPQLGLADFRGERVKVYDLAALLGYPPIAQPRYLVRFASRPIGFAFERFEGHVRLSKRRVSVHPIARERSSAPPATPTIIDLPGLVARICELECSPAGEA